MTKINLRRKIADGKTYMPEIDGLRFIAIILVLFYHILSYVSIKFNIPFENIFFLPFLNGSQGVQFFFIISGFILAMPFASKYPKGESISLKSYFYRRLTRLEPPYIISLVLFFSILVFNGKYTFWGLLDNLFASMLYVHNILYGKGSDINTVAWSLEVEVQFYILVPLLSLGFKTSKIKRRFIFFLIFFASVFFNFQYDIYYRTIFGQGHYFMLGMILSDLFVSKDLPKIRYSIFGFIGIFIVFYIDRSLSNFNEFVFIIGCSMLFCSVLVNEYWRTLFSLKGVSLVGGMCYSIYLLHYPIISFFGNLISKFFIPTHVFDFFIYLLLLFPIILVISLIFYLLIEKPCMDSNWPSKVKMYLSKK